MDREALEQFEDAPDNIPALIRRMRQVNDAVWALLFIELGNMLLFISRGLLTPKEAIDRLQQSRVLLAQTMDNDRAAVLIDDVIRLLQRCLSAEPPIDPSAKLAAVEAEVRQYLASWPAGPTRH